MAVALQQRHIVTACGETTGGLHTRWAAPDDGDLFARHDRRQPRFRLETSFGIDGAAGRLSFIDRADTGVAIDAGQDLARRAGFELRGQSRICKEFTAHGDEVRFAVADSLVAHLDLDASRQNDRDVDRGLDRRGFGRVERGFVWRMRAGMQRADGRVVVGGDGDGVGASRFQHARGGDGVFCRDAARALILD